MVVPILVEVLLAVVFLIAGVLYFRMAPIWCERWRVRDIAWCERHPRWAWLIDPSRPVSLDIFRLRAAAIGLIFFGVISLILAIRTIFVLIQRAAT